MAWENLPEELLIKIFEYLPLTDLRSVLETCQKWNNAGLDDILWRNLTRRDYNIPRNRLHQPVQETWRLEYQRLSDQTPCVCVDILSDHSDEVLYVSFSRCGQYFVTCSKDGSFIVWRINSDGTGSLLHRQDMTPYGWRYTWAAKFNSSTTLLLVAGVIDDVDGSLAIFQFTDNNEVILGGIFDNNPYDVMGTWCDDHTWMTGNIITRADFMAVDADIRIHRLVSPGPGLGPGTVIPLTNLALKYRYPTNDGSNYFRCLLVSNRRMFSNDRIFPDYDTSFRHSTNIITTLEQDNHEDGFNEAYSSQDVVLIFLCNGNTSTPHQLGFKRLYPENVTRVPVISEADKVLDMRGHIVGIALDRTGQYLYVNIRKWPDGARPALHLPPPIATEIEMHVLDLQTLTFLDIQYYGHKGYTDSLGAFYIYLDTSDTLVSSGSEDHRAYIWDKKYGCKLAVNTHDNVVNSVAFNPHDPETLVTVGDDHKVKIWISKRKRRLLGNKNPS